MKMKESKQMVYIDCLTYNHATYIEDTMRGFCIQQTSFPFVAIIIDDASTDGEQEIIRTYLNKHFDMMNARQWETDEAQFIEARHKVNTNCTFAVVLLKYNFHSQKKAKRPLIEEWTRTKYVAFCEGDDYWTNGNKLQRQVEYMESHIDCPMCFHKVKVKAEIGRDTKEEKMFDFLEEKDYTREDQLRIRRVVPTCSILMKTEVLMHYPTNSKFTIGDVVLVATALTYGNIRCISCEDLAVYRLAPGGWTAKPDIDICRDMVPQSQGMIESFSWYRGKEGYAILDFWTFSLLTFLKNLKQDEEFRRVADDYKLFMGTNHLWKFHIYYFNRKSRALMRKLFGEAFVGKIRKLLIRTK